MIIKQKIFFWVKTVLIIYCMFGIAFYYLQNYILFHPKALEVDFQFQFKQPFIELNLKYNDATTFNLVQFIPNDDTIAKGVVLYFHGNKENINHYAEHSNDFTKNNYEVWMCDYPTFGKSTGKLTEQILYEEAAQVYKLARIKFTPQQIIIYGKSMGTGIAAQLASKNNCKNLILETPYYSYASVIKRYLPIYPVETMVAFKIPTYQYSQQVRAPITIFHGTDDDVIVLSNAQKLKSVMKPNDQFIIIKGGQHNTLPTYKIFQQKIDSIMQH